MLRREAAAAEVAETATARSASADAIGMEAKLTGAEADASECATASKTRAAPAVETTAERMTATEVAEGDAEAAERGAALTRATPATELAEEAVV